MAGYRKMFTVALHSFFPDNLHVDFLKIDVESMETMVMLGAEELFKSHRIGRAVVEVTQMRPLDPVYKRVLGYGYKMACVTLTVPHPQITRPPPVLTYLGVADVDKINSWVEGGKCVDWEFCVECG